MQARWKIVGGTSAIGLGVMLLVVVGHSRRVSGDNTSTPSSEAFVDPMPRDPFAQYPTPGAIAYEQLTAADKAAVDRIQEATDTSQPSSSYAAFASATAWTSDEADRQLAERSVGLTETADDGVVP